MDNADLFKYLLINKAIPEETISDYEFGFKTVFYGCGPLHCYCRCAYDHEYFSYISERGEIDLAKCDTLATAIKDGHCQHAARVAKKVYLSETRINVFHISAAIGCMDLSQQFLSGFEKATLKSYDIKSRLFRMHPYEVAALKCNKNVAQLLYHVDLPATTPRPQTTERRWTDKVIYASEKEDNKVEIRHVSLIEVCITKKNEAIIKMLLDTLVPAQHPDDRIQVYEYLFK